MENKKLFMFLEKTIKKNYDLTLLNTFRLNARAEFFAIVKNGRELAAAVNWAKAKKLPLNILAGGSNILLVNQKIKGLVLKLSGQAHAIAGNRIDCWAGMGLTKLALLAAKAGLSGLEWACGIPGSLGGAVRGNSGAYGSAMSNVVVEVQAYDLASGRLIKLNNRACRFVYHGSIFKKKKDWLIVHVKIKLKSSGKTKEIKKICEKNLTHRLATKPKDPSAGCIFKNLLYKKIVKQNKPLAADLAAKGLVRGGKIAAGYLIDQLGLKGKSVGGAKVSEKHANFIINTGQAQAADVIYLINLIKKKIKAEYKINLEEEIQYFGR